MPLMPLMPFMPFKPFMPVVSFIIGHCDMDSFPICMCCSMSCIIFACIFSIGTFIAVRCSNIRVRMSVIRPTFLSSNAQLMVATCWVSSAS